MLQTINGVRIGWDKSFKKMHKNGNDKLLRSGIFEDEIFEEFKSQSFSQIIRTNSSKHILIKYQ